MLGGSSARTLPSPEVSFVATAAGDLTRPFVREGLHSCGTAPDSHRISLWLWHPVQDQAEVTLAWPALAPGLLPCRQWPQAPRAQALLAPTPKDRCRPCLFIWTLGSSGVTAMTLSIG
jgi:hypothetical protein